MLQQNLNKFDIMIMILNASDNKLQTLEPFVRELEYQFLKPVENNVVEIKVT